MFSWLFHGTDVSGDEHQPYQVKDYVSGLYIAPCATLHRTSQPSWMCVCVYMYVVGGGMLLLPLLIGFPISSSLE